VLPLPDTSVTSDIDPAEAAPALALDLDASRALRARPLVDLRAANVVYRTLQVRWLAWLGKRVARIGLALRIPGVAWLLRRTVYRLFCGGETLAEVAATADSLGAQGVGTILDYAAEGKDTPAAAERAFRELVRSVDAAGNEHIRFCAVKLSAIASARALRGGDDAALARAADRLDTLVERAAARDVAIFVDAEESWVQPAIDRLAEAAMRRHNRAHARVHTTLQLYLRDRLPYLRRLIADARADGYRLGVKLVRGAYLEKEAERAAVLGYANPLQPTKTATDADFDAAVTLCLQNLDCVEPCVATHNEASMLHFVAEMRRLGIPVDHPGVTVAQLLGMRDRLTFPLAEAGYRALKYVPYGPVREAMPYLLRRADENTAVAAQLGEELAAIRAELRRRGTWAI
jgi:proline dehydrogenase